MGYVHLFGGALLGWPGAWRENSQAVVRHLPAACGCRPGSCDQGTLTGTDQSCLPDPLPAATQSRGEYIEQTRFNPDVRAGRGVGVERVKG